MARGIPYSESVPINVGAGANQIAVLVSNPDPNAYPAVLHMDTTVDADVTQLEIGWYKAPNFEAFFDTTTPTQLIGVFQMPLTDTYRGASLAARIDAGGDTTGTRILVDGEFKR